MDDEEQNSRSWLSPSTAHLSDEAIQPRHFQYQALKHPRDVRLLRVSRCQNSNRILGEFTEVSLDSPFLNYKAISYCWGDATPRERIWLSKNEYLGITESAADILRHFISKNKSGYFWIDALRIDQNKNRENEEKGQQIRLMKDIFATAKCVVIWLENSSADSDLAMEYLGILSNVIEGLVSKEKEKRELSHAQMTFIIRKSPDPRSKALDNLLRRQWFSRIWIVQEIVMASQKVVACGNSIADWDALVRVMRFFQNSKLGYSVFENENLDDICTPLKSGNRLVLIAHYCDSVKSGNLPPFQKILAFLRKFEATDSRDKVFVVLGLASDLQDAIFTPEYDSAPQDIFIKFCRFLMTRDANLYLLHIAGIEAPRILDNHPSWAADLSTTEDYNSLIFLPDAVDWRPSGEESQVLIHEHPSIPKAIVLSGFIVDSVNMICPPFNAEDIPNSWEQYRQWGSEIAVSLNNWTRLVESLSPYPTSEASSDVCWRTLLCNITKSGYIPTAEYSTYHRHFLGFYEAIANSESAEQFGELLTGWWDQDEFNSFLRALSLSSTRRLFTTTNGYAGKGAGKNTFTGDKICIFHGAKTPFIIRPNPKLVGEELTYTLVCDCYVHGLMYGEGLKLGITEDIVLI